MATAIYDLPVSTPVSIVRGDSFATPKFRHKDLLGAYIDTSGWTLVGNIYENDDCGSTVLVTLTMEHLPAPEYGYQGTLTSTQTALLECSARYYDIETTDGTLVRTYIDGPVTISGV